MTVVMHTFHPAYLLRGQRRFEGLVVQAFGKLRRCETGWRPKWDRTGYITRPNLSTVLKVLREMAKSGRRVSYDIETDGKHPLVCTIRCIAFWDGKRGICVPFVFRAGDKEEVIVEGKKKPVLRARWTPYFGEAELAQAKQAIQLVFDSCPLDTQNGQYDRLCLEARMDFAVPSPADDPKKYHDSILAHHIVASYFPHNLGFLASVYTEAPYYKTTDDGDAWSSESDAELWQYNCDDVQVQYTVCTKTREEITERAEDKYLFQHDAWQERECQRWRHVGAVVDENAIRLLRKEYGTIRDKSLAAMRAELAKQSGNERSAELDELLDKLVGDSDETEQQDDGRTEDKFNPASLAQLRLLLKHLGIPLTAETATGQLSTAKEFLLEARRELLLNGAKPGSPAVGFLDFLFSWREASKLESTYLHPELIPEESGLVWKISPGEREQLKGLLGLHPTFNAHVVPTGRLASSGPNCFSGDTEVLTHSGWCRFDKLPEGVQVAQWVNGGVEFVFPTEYVKQESTDWMSLTNEHIDLMVTGDHRCLLRHRKSGELRVFSARDYPEDWQQLNAAQYQPQSTWDLSDDLLKLVVATQADGYLVEGVNGWHIEFTLSKKRKVERLQGILDGLKVPYTTRKKKQTRGVKGKATIFYVRQCMATATVGTLLGKDKTFKPWVMMLKPEQLKLFSSEVMLWDGCASRMNHYASAEKSNADWVQLSYVLTGRRANVRVYTPKPGAWGSSRPSYQVDVTHRDYSLTTNINRMRFSGIAATAYCVSVPSSYLLVRRNGKVMVTGNCQNQPEDIRGIFIARPGHVLVTGDWDALEMRLAAILSGDQKLLKVFEEYDAGTGPKPHIVNAAAIFGLPLNEELPKKYPGCYRAAKVFAYAVAYGAGPTTVYDQVRKEMPDLEFREFMRLYSKYKSIYPRLFEFQRDVVMRGTQHQYLDSGVLKRRVYFLERVMGEDSPEASKMQNMPYQSTGADVVSLANRRIMKRVVLPWRETRLQPGEHLEQLAQVHDELLFEVPVRLAEEFAARYKSIAEETPFAGEARGRPFAKWKLPVAVNILRPLAPGAPSRWKPLHASSACCETPSTVEIDRGKFRGKCGKCEKPFTLEIQ